MDSRLGIVVACLVLTAGCNVISPGPGVPGDETAQTVTPVPVTADGSESRTTPPGHSLPPGVHLNGTVDAARLRAAHNASIEGRSYTWVYRRDRIDGREVTRMFRRNVLVDGQAVVVRDSSQRLLPNRSLYLTRTGGYQRRGGNVSRVSVLRPMAHREYAPGGRLLREFLPDRPATVRAIERNGHQLYRLYVPPGGPPVAFRSDAGEGWSVLHYRVTVYATPAGHVRTVIAEYERALATGESYSVSMRFDYTAVGETSVTRPGWVPRTNETATSNETTTRGTP